MARIQDVLTTIDESDRIIVERLELALKHHASAPTLTSGRSLLHVISRRSSNAKLSARASGLSSGGLSPRTTRVSALTAPSECSSSEPTSAELLQCVCMELVATEGRYLRDLQLLQSCFASKLEESLSRMLLPNLGAIIGLSENLEKRMSAAAASHRGADLAAALGAELATLAPFFGMFVDYCAGFMPAFDELCRLRKLRPQLDALVEAAEEEIGRAAAADAAGHDAPRVLIFAYIIKPVQRLCQYPLLFKEVIKVMAEAMPTAEARETLGAVLAQLERAAADVNERVRRVETEARLWAELGNNEWRSKLESTALVLVRDFPVEIVKSGKNRSLSFGSVRIRRSLSFKKRDAEAEGKLYLFTDCLLLAKRDKEKGKYKLKAAWMLAAVSVELRGEKSGEPDGGVDKTKSMSLRSPSIDSKSVSLSLEGAARQIRAASLGSNGEVASSSSALAAEFSSATLAAATASPVASGSETPRGGEAVQSKRSSKGSVECASPAGAADLLVLKHETGPSFVLRVEGSACEGGEPAAVFVRDHVWRLKEGVASRKLSASRPAPAAAKP